MAEASLHHGFVRVQQFEKQEGYVPVTRRASNIVYRNDDARVVAQRRSENKIARAALGGRTQKSPPRRHRLLPSAHKRQTWHRRNSAYPRGGNVPTLFSESAPHHRATVGGVEQGACTWMMTGRARRPEF